MFICCSVYMWFIAAIANVSFFNVCFLAMHCLSFVHFSLFPILVYLKKLAFFVCLFQLQNFLFFLKYWFFVCVCGYHFFGINVGKNLGFIFLIFSDVLEMFCFMHYLIHGALYFVILSFECARRIQYILSFRFLRLYIVNAEWIR